MQAFAEMRVRRRKVAEHRRIHSHAPVENHRLPDVSKLAVERERFCFELVSADKLALHRGERGAGMRKVRGHPRIAQAFGRSPQLHRGENVRAADPSHRSPESPDQPVPPRPRRDHRVRGKCSAPLPAPPRIPDKNLQPRPAGPLRPVRGRARYSAARHRDARGDARTPPGSP